MSVLVFGALNIDHVYQVHHLVRPGETLSSTAYSRNCGGKALNQSIALARAGLSPFLAGAVGMDGRFLLDLLIREGVDIKHVRCYEDMPSGHAMIQVDSNGENCILLFGGANQAITPSDVADTINGFLGGDWVVLQNEINRTGEIAMRAKEKGMRVVWNPSPIPGDWSMVPASFLDMLILNEVEGRAFCKTAEPEEQMHKLREAFPHCEIVLTLGEQGACIYDPGEEEMIRQAAIPAEVVDTTAAGDTFLGYYVSMRYRGEPVEKASALASLAASRAIGKPGAADSIPRYAELQ